MCEEFLFLFFDHVCCFVLDINECEGSTSQCVSVASCNNLPGNFSCVCPKGFKGDGTRNGTGCTSFGGGGNQTVVISIALGKYIYIYIYWN